MNLHDKETITRLAEHVGMSRAKAAGLLKGVGMRKDRQNRYLTAKALEVLNAAVDPARSAGRAISGRDGNADAPVALSNYADARAEGERMRCEKIRLELEIKKGNLIDRQIVIDAGQDVLAHIRVGLTGLAPRIAAKLLDKDTATISRILTEEIENTLRDLADADAFMNKTLGL